MTFSIPNDQFRPVGATGLRAPPIIFSACALGNTRRVVADQTRLAICAEWLRHVAAPVLISVAYTKDGSRELEALGKFLQRLDVRSDEVAVVLKLELSREIGDSGQANYNHVLKCWEKSSLLLGADYRPQLIALANANDDAWSAVSELKQAGKISAAGVATRDFHTPIEVAPAADWVTLAGGFSLMRHLAEGLAWMADLAKRQIPIVLSSVFDGGFLVGGNRLDGRVLNPEDPADRTLLAWRKTFVALCEGHGITPAHACIQFALSVPSVIAVEVGSSFPDRTVENVHSACQKVPDKFWASMKEEGLLEPGFLF